MGAITAVTKGRPLNTPEPVAGDGPRIRVVLGKMRFDAHDVGARYIMRKLVEAGMEVIFIRFALVQELVDAALQEDVHVIGLSSLTGGHMSVARDLVEEARRAGLADRLIVVGGVIADRDVEEMRRLGVHGVFGPGSTPQQIVDFIRSNVRLDADA
jgi:methylmalonyl-CoA mutase C-terminal domain/subunit